ncbi:hypothetical protein ABPG75_002305 [Micractinium tetrahymenae]
MPLRHTVDRSPSAAVQAGQLEQAVEHYSAALRAEPSHVPTLCNRSLAALKLGLPENALRDAEAALDALTLASGDSSAQTRLAKAVHRKAEALAAMGRLIDCLQAYRRGLAAWPGCPELHAALRLAVEDLPVPWLAKYWARHVEAAQAPNPLSSRDGRLLRPVPAEHRLAPAELQGHLEEALYALQDEARDLLCDAWAQARRPGRADAAFMRAAAYLHAGNARQAVKDLRLALVYGPQLEGCPASWAQQAGASADQSSGGGSSSALVKRTGGAGKREPAAAPPELPPPAAAEAAGQRSAWPAALGLFSAALEALADNVPAALAAQRAHQLDPENAEYAEALERLLRRIPEPCAAALHADGAAGLEAHLAAEREGALPEFKRHRPKYYYYYEWMKKRIYGQYPELPEPVMDRMLALEANELDMLLQYPRATQVTVERLMHVYESEGPERLETYEVPLLTWDDYQAIKEQPLALPAGDSAAAAAGGRLLEGGSGGAAEARAAVAGEGAAPASRAAVHPPPVVGPALVTAAGREEAEEAGSNDGVLDDHGGSEAGSIDVDDVDELFELD